MKSHRLLLVLAFGLSTLPSPSQDATSSATAETPKTPMPNLKFAPASDPNPPTAPHKFSEEVKAGRMPSAKNFNRWAIAAMPER